MREAIPGRRIRYVTDLAYPDRGRRHCDEDVFLASRLRDTAALMDASDAVMVRNSGPVLHYQDAYDAFRARALASGARGTTR